LYLDLSFLAYLADRANRFPKALGDLEKWVERLPPPPLPYCGQLVSDDCTAESAGPSVPTTAPTTLDTSRDLLRLLATLGDGL